MKQPVNISKNLLQFDSSLNSIRRRNRSNTREKVRIAKGLPKDFFRPIKTEQEIFQFQYSDDGLKTPAFKNQRSLQTKYKQFFPNKRQISLQVYDKPNTLPLRRQFPTRLYLNKARFSREKPNSYRNYQQQQRQPGMKSISSQRQQIKFKTKLNIDIVCTDTSEDLRKNKIRKNISKFFAQQGENPKNAKLKQGKLPPLVI